MKITVDFTKSAGPVKAMHGVGQPPLLGKSCKYFHYLTEAGIPYSRLHDVGGAYGGCVFVDIPNLFRDFSADAEREESYDFAFTDVLISGLMKANCMPIFRLGVTIENQSDIRAYRIDPPEDPEKWALICEHIVRHYNEGWANGFRFGIEYWEIWNEPDNGPVPQTNRMWRGTNEEYYKLYEVTAKHLKKCFGNTVKVGGYGASGFYFEEDCRKGIGTDRCDHFLEFFEGFLQYIQAHGAPLDFFSWHSYAPVSNAELSADHVDKKLSEYGYADTETQLNEWNTISDLKDRGSSFAAATCAAMMISQQNKKTKICCFYDARIGVSLYSGLFNPLTLEPFCTYYVFKAFGELYALKHQAECVCDEKDVYALAAADGDKKAILISNTSGEDKEIKINIDKSFSVFLIDENNYINKTDYAADDFVLKKHQVVLIKDF